MRDGVNFREVLAPAEGLEAIQQLFTSPPIESLEWLKELGEIARRSLDETPEALAQAASTATVASAEPPPSLALSTSVPPEPVETEKSNDARLLEALLEYHRLRGPTLGARTAPMAAQVARSEGSAPPGERFTSAEIPVIQNYQPKAGGAFYSKQPTHSILRPKPGK